MDNKPLLSWQPPLRNHSVMVMLACAVLLLPNSSVNAAVGNSDNGVLEYEWDLDINIVYGWGFFGVTPALDDAGPGVNQQGGEPDANLELITGSDGLFNHVNPGPGGQGMWRVIDSTGAVERSRDTQCDEARGNIGVVDLDGDGINEYVGSTTSGVCMEIMDRELNFVWTYQTNGSKLPTSGGFEFPAAPSAGDVNPAHPGLEVANLQRPTCDVMLWSGLPGGDTDGDSYPNGTLLWSTNLPGTDCHSTTTMADVDHDGELEIIAAVNSSAADEVFVLDGDTGAVETSYHTGSVQASVSVADLDGDGYLEMAVGDLLGNFHIFKWDGAIKSTVCSTVIGSPIYSSAAIGDVNGDGAQNLVVADFGGKVTALNSDCSVLWSFDTGSNMPFYASPALANRSSFGVYGKEWPMFQHDAQRSGNYGASDVALDIYIGNMNDYLYLLDGNTGAMIDRFETSGNIHGSAAVGDIDGDQCLEVAVQSWGSFSGSAPKDQYDAIWNVQDKKSCTITVQIDIKPGSDPNCFNNNGNGVIPVAILGSASLDVNNIDPSTVQLQGLAVKAVGKANKLLASVEDSNGDGFDDLVVKIEDVDGTFNSGDGTATLTGNLYNGTAIVGSDAICVVPDNI